MTQRIINDSFWTDPYVEDLEPNEKLLFLYLLSNPLCNIAGIYEIKRKRISYETGIDIQSLSKALEGFEKDGKLLLVGNWVFIKNFPKNQSLNPNVTKGIQRVIDSIPEFVLVELNKAFGSLGKALQYLTILNFTLPNFTLSNSKELEVFEKPIVVNNFGLDNTEVETPVYGNKEINDILSFLSKSVGIDEFKESQKWQRVYGKHFCNYISKHGKENFIERLKLILADDFKLKNCNSIKYLYNEIKAFIHSPVVEKKSKGIII